MRRHGRGRAIRRFHARSCFTPAFRREISPHRGCKPPPVRARVDGYTILRIASLKKHPYAILFRRGCEVHLHISFPASGRTFRRASMPRAMAPPWSRRFPLSSSGAAERRSVRACLDSICFLSIFSLDPIANLLFVSRKVRQVRKVILKIKLRVLCELGVRFIHGVCCLGNAGTIDNRTRHWRMLCGERHDPHNATRIRVAR